MPEAGGPTNQSGVHYQNGIAARYLGRLCDRRQRPVFEQVVEVRVEAPGAVGDVVVTYADAHHDWLHAKEHLEPGSAPFKKVWKDFAARLRSNDFGHDDRLVLVTDDEHPMFRYIEEVARRAKGAGSIDELTAGLVQKYVDAVAKVGAELDADSGTALFRLFQHLAIEILPYEALARDLPPVWMPDSSLAPLTLYCLLRDRIGEHARVRRSFTAVDLERVLRDAHGVVLKAPASTDVLYRSTLQRLYARLEIVGTEIEGDSSAFYVPPTLRVVSKATAPLLAEAGDRPRADATARHVHVDRVARERDHHGRDGNGEVVRCVRARAASLPQRLPRDLPANASTPRGTRARARRRYVHACARPPREDRRPDSRRLGPRAAS